MMSYHAIGSTAKANSAKPWTPQEVLYVVNAVSAKVLSPLIPAINAVPGVPSKAKAALISKLSNKPYDALLDILDPIEAALIRITKRVNRATGKMTRKIFLASVDMRQVDEWPSAIRSKLDPSVANVLRRFLALNHFIALFWDEPLLLAAEMYKEGFDIADQMVDAVAKKFGMSPGAAKLVVSQMHSTIPVKPDQALAWAKAGTAAWSAAEKAVTSAADDVARFLGLGVLPAIAAGVGALDAGVAAAVATEVAAIGGVTLPPGITALVGWVLVAVSGLTVAGLSTAIGTGIYTMSENAQTQAQAQADVARTQAQAQADAMRIQAQSGQAPVVSQRAGKSTSALLLAGAGAVAAVAGAPIWVPVGAGALALMALAKDKK